MIMISLLLSLYSLFFCPLGSYRRNKLGLSTARLNQTRERERKKSIQYVRQYELFFSMAR